MRILPDLGNKTKKATNKERRKKSKSSNHNKSIERASTQLDQFNNKQGGKIDYNDPILITPRSFSIGGQHSSKFKLPN